MDHFNSNPKQFCVEIFDIIRNTYDFMKFYEDHYLVKLINTVFII